MVTAPGEFGLLLMLLFALLPAPTGDTDKELEPEIADVVAVVTTEA